MDNLDEKYKSKNPFTVPDGYFDALEDRVMSRVKENEMPKQTSLLLTLKPYLGLAALFAFAMVVVQLVLPGAVDENRMLIKKGEQPEVIASQTEDENIFDADFNPSREEIIEYLSQETDPLEFLYAENR